MELIAQGSAYQYTHDYVEVSEWHPDRGAWITLPKYRDRYPFVIKNSAFPQPYLDEAHHDESEPNWKEEREGRYF